MMQCSSFGVLFAFCLMISLDKGTGPAAVGLASSFLPCVLVSAGTELTLFLVAGTVLCFGFSVRRMMLITL